MGGKAEMLDPSLLFLLDKVIDYSPLFVLIYGKRVFIDVVKQIKIEIFDLAFLQLILENGCGVIA